MNKSHDFVTTAMTIIYSTLRLQYRNARTSNFDNSILSTNRSHVRSNYFLKFEFYLDNAIVIDGFRIFFIPHQHLSGALIQRIIQLGQFINAIHVTLSPPIS